MLTGIYEVKLKHFNITVYIFENSISKGLVGKGGIRVKSFNLIGHFECVREDGVSGCDPPSEKIHISHSFTKHPRIMSELKLSLQFIRSCILKIH